MLRRSFVHLPTIGASTERKLWQAGIGDWDKLEQVSATWFRGPRRDEVLRELEASRQALEQGQALFFYQRLPRRELWRMIPDFRNDIAFLDIETDGLKPPPSSQSTSITFYFRGQVLQAYELEAKRALVQRMAEEAQIFCTFFGEVFDIPFLRREFELSLEKAQIDLSFWLRRLGFEGGLKKIEKCFSQVPPRQFEIGGADAVRLWHWHQKGTPGALDTLLTYNAEDAVVLEPLLISGFNMELQARPHFVHAPMEYPLPPQLTTSVSLPIYERLRRSVDESSRNTASII